jgi:3-phenylpropionate/trans-cinnamate dioxygenase ferredoxin component
MAATQLFFWTITMSHHPWTDLGPESEFSTKEHTCVDSPENDGTRGTALVIVKNDGSWYALENRCPHAGRPLGDGACAGMTITCPYHGYTYHIKTGKNIDFPEEETPVKTFSVRVEGGHLQVQLTSDEADNS